MLAREEAEASSRGPSTAKGIIDGTYHELHLGEAERLRSSRAIDFPRAGRSRCRCAAFESGLGSAGGRPSAANPWRFHSSALASLSAAPSGGDPTTGSRRGQRPRRRSLPHRGSGRSDDAGAARGWSCLPWGCRRRPRRPSCHAARHREAHYPTECLRCWRARPEVRGGQHWPVTFCLGAEDRGCVS